MAEDSLLSPGVWSTSFPSRMNRKEISGWDRAILSSTPATELPSAASFFRNFMRAGVLKNRSRTTMVVPAGQPASSKESSSPPPQRYLAPVWASWVRVSSSTWATAEMEANASPRKPRVPMASRSSCRRILLVACRRKAVGTSSGAMPQPLSVTRM